MRHLALGRAHLCMISLAALACAEAEAQERIGDFTFTSRADRLAEADRSYVSTDAVGTTFAVAPSLFWRCAGPSIIELALLVDELEGTDGHVSVQWRFGREPPSESRLWPLSDERIAIFAPDPDRDAFTRAASTATEVLVRVVDGGHAFDTRFALGGLEEALGRLPCRAALADLDPSPVEADPAAHLPDHLRDIADRPYTVPPRLLNGTEAARAIARVYPARMREAGIGGTVKVFLWVDVNGQVLDRRIDVSSGWSEIDEAAMQVAALLRFRPALHENEPVAVWVSFPINFEVR